MTSGTGSEHGGGEVAGVVEEVLAVVEHEEQVPHLEELDDALDQRQSGTLLTPERIGDHLSHQRVVVGGGELAHPRAVGEPRRELGRDLQRQTRLADAAGARERDEPGVRRARPRAPTTSSSRPTNDVSCDGRLPGRSS